MPLRDFTFENYEEMYFSRDINYLDIMHLIKFLKLNSKIFTEKLPKEDTTVRSNVDLM